MSQNLVIRKKIQSHVDKHHNVADKIMPLTLMIAASISVLTTLGIVVTLVSDAVHFFSAVPLKEVFGTDLHPLGNTPSYGFLPIISGTFFTALIAMFVAVPIGLMTATYLSEFASDKSRKILKPVLELLAGVPTIVYGFFAYQVITPMLMKMIPNLGAKNVLSAGIVMGVMIIPMIASLSEDAMRSVPNALRDGALGLGSTKFEVAKNVVMPSAISGIVASIVLAVSRAIGETMIVVIASGSSKKLTFDITQSMQTMTSYIVEFTSGDAASGTVGYYSLYAVGLILFAFTLTMNMAAQYISKKFREEY